MKKIILIFVLMSLSFSAQNQRFIYDYSFVSDSLNKGDVTKELMYLDIFKDQSKFYSRDVFVADSIMIAKYEKEIMSSGSMNVVVSNFSGKKASVKNKIFKSYPNYEVSLETRVGQDLFNITDDRKLEWKIFPEKIKIGEFDAQKAITNFAGRQWTAYFTTALPFQDGPYKFHGLPGLIVQMEDATKTHRFDLTGVTKFTNVESKVSQFNQPQKPVTIDQAKYKKMFWEMRNDPAKNFKLMASKGNVSIKDASGDAISTSDLVKKIESDAKEKLAKDNNNIELDLLKK